MLARCMQCITLASSIDNIFSRMPKLSLHNTKYEKIKPEISHLEEWASLMARTIASSICCWTSARMMARKAALSSWSRCRVCIREGRENGSSEDSDGKGILDRVGGEELL
jgi:hypothetical protein